MKNNFYPIIRLTLHSLPVILSAVKSTIMSNVVEVVGTDKNLVNMLKTVKAVGLDTVLDKKGPFTIFAPTDIAFGKLQAGRMENLLKPENKEKLTELLNH